MIFFIIGASFIWFLVSLIMFLATDKQDAKKRKTRGILMIVSSVVFALFVIAIVALMIYISRSVALYM